MKMRNSLAILLQVVLTQRAVALGRSVEGAVTFQVRAFAGLRIEGKSGEISLDDQGDDLVVRVPLASLTTGIDLRDRHLRGSLEADKFPVAVLRVRRAGLAFPKEGDAVDGNTTGELTLRGQSRPVAVSYRAERTGAITEVHGSMELDMRQFGVEPPSYLGVRIKPLVEVAVRLSVAGL